MANSIVLISDESLKQVERQLFRDRFESEQFTWPSFEPTKQLRIGLEFLASFALSGAGVRLAEWPNVAAQIATQTNAPRE